MCAVTVPCQQSKFKPMGKMEKIRKYKHYATGEIIEVSENDGVGFYNGKYFYIVEKSDGSQLKGTSFFSIAESDGGKE